MLNRFGPVYSIATSVARSVPLVLALCLIGCGGVSSPNAAITPPVPPSASGISATSFGFQCSTDLAGCPDNDNGEYTWPATQAQPGVLRLWDSSTEWNVLNPNSGSYSWNDLDKWLDAIAANQPRAVIYTFGWVPFWDAPNTGTCLTASTRGSACPPVDLTATGSPTFNAFVTALVGHCSPAGNCVSKFINYFELWNEPDTSIAWAGTPAQLYQMLKPAEAIITGAVSGAQILGPALSANPNTSTTWMCSFLGQEVSNGTLSSIYGFHIYLQNTTPETRLANALTQISPNSSSGSACSLSGWTAHPMWLTETNYANSSQPNPYTCDTALYSATDCTGQIVRWQLLLNSNGVSNVTWYSWMPTIGSIAPNETAYYYMMKYLEGGKFPGPCSSTTNGGLQTWTCIFTEGSGTQALFVWTPTEAGTSYTVPSGYTDYRDFSGGTTTITSGQTITIGPEPFMLEK